jgi:uncharacterized membrane protein YciS (DUF1049 family)
MTMRTLISFLIGLLTMAAIVALGFVVAQNDQNVQVTVQGTSFQFAQGWMVAGAAALGFLLAYLLLIPGRLASAFRTGSLSRQGQRLEQRLQGLREEHAQLQGSHQRLLEEHHHVLSQVLAPMGAGREPTAPSSPAMPAATAEDLQRTGPIFLPRQAMYPDGEDQPTRQQPTLMDRVRQRFAAWWAGIRAWFQRRRDRAADRSSPPNSPTSATS